MALVRMKRADALLAMDSEAAERIWSLALARAVQDEMGVPLRITGFRLERRSLGELAEMLPEMALICALDEGAGEATGVAVLDAALMAGMVEAMTTGVITPADRGGARRPTRTDAALLAPVLDRALTALEAGANEAGLSDLARGFRFAATVDGARGLSLLLEDVPYRLLAAEVDIAAGARQGAVLLAFPEGRAVGGMLAPVVADGDFTAALAQQVGGAEARLEAVLIRLTLPLGAVMELQVGQDLALPRADIARVFIEGLDGRRVATGKLGRNGSLRAIRLVAEAEAPALPAAPVPARVERR
ncbi:FliM/FliN family flagellar motor switch protein [Paragemmobacter ruber]|uniref:Flagellar motor switch protein FliM n=1 Tax=Paragemmobacter ruber TaxID=1985673 RepID=A0ABW9Y8D1_9RHOB|nr:FliM/FliN family flagellar motor C-terminal domain-containing protein [Rhodobacter ruber]NBE08769.1 flagellar motor switch protein FliM [Rhodobacter ruber]